MADEAHDRDALIKAVTELVNFPDNPDGPPWWWGVGPNGKLLFRAEDEAFAKLLPLLLLDVLPSGQEVHLFGPDKTKDVFAKPHTVNGKTVNMPAAPPTHNTPPP